MDFCPECGTRLILKRDTSGEQVITALICPNCNYSRQIEAKEATPKEDKTMPTIKIECPKCGNYEAYWWMVQTRGSDESPTQFFRCTKCNYTWRENA
jgi:DNA-directed RNA polymerase subunit M